MNSKTIFRLRDLENLKDDNSVYRNQESSIYTYHSSEQILHMSISNSLFEGNNLKEGAIFDIQGAFSG